MNSPHAQPQLTPHSALSDGVIAQLAALQSQVHSLSAEIKRCELKIQLLTLELAQHKRLRFGCKSEALSSVQRDALCT